MKILLVLCVLLAACSSDDSEQAGGEFAGNDGNPERNINFSWTEPPVLRASNSPFEVGDVDAEYVANVPCGNHFENRFDVFLPVAEAPTPLIVFIHGGGFRAGDKNEAWKDFSQQAMEAVERGVAFATINYRLLDDVDSVGVYKPLTDSGRCLQFMRYHGDTLNIDPEKVALMGKSAGAGTSLWLAFHEDLADPLSEIPVFEESTRVRAVAAFETQATYDLIKWSSLVFREYGVNVIGMAALMGLEQTLLSFYAVTEVEALELPEIVAYRADVDMHELMSDDDAPFWVQNKKIKPAVPLSDDIAFHHPNHAKVLYDRAQEIGLENVAYIPELNINSPSNETAVDFLIRHLESVR